MKKNSTSSTNSVPAAKLIRNGSVPKPGSGEGRVIRIVNYHDESINERVLVSTKAYLTTETECVRDLKTEESRWLFSSHFKTLLKQLVFLEAAKGEAKIGSSLSTPNYHNHVKLVLIPDTHCTMIDQWFSTFFLVRFPNLVTLIIGRSLKELID